MYQVLYRKYRPVDFDSVVGQDSIIKTLKNSIKNSNFSHAYMFFGPRGTGKTSVSKIFARNINCLNPQDGTACHECDACKVSFSKDCVDIIEIDAASNNGVDEIRDLKNKISLVPSELKYKVYIIDEVHMLSIGAFNALLKTLEEPPAHAIFILATTDPQKVPETIISRCQCYSFKRISDENLYSRLKFVCNEENIDIEDEVLKNIAILSDGGLRDALGMLDMLSSYCESKITLSDLENLNGTISNLEISKLYNCIFSSDIKEMLLLINDYNSKGKNLIQIVVQLLNFCRNIVVDYYLLDKKCDYSLNKVQSFVNILNDRINDMKKSGNPKFFIEMLFIKFVNDHLNGSNYSENTLVDKNIPSNFSQKNEQIIKNIDILNNNIDKVAVNDSKSTNFSVTDSDESIDNINTDDLKVESDIKVILNISEIMHIRANNTLVNAKKPLLASEMSKFDELKTYVYNPNYGFIVSGLLDSNLCAVSEDSIIISFEYESKVENLVNNIFKIEEVYNEITNSNKKISILSSKDWNQLKNDYIVKKKNNIDFSIIDEPLPLFEESKKDDIIVNSAVELFGDIVEID